jgi:hypothetical protein
MATTRPTASTPHRPLRLTEPTAAVVCAEPAGLLAALHHMASMVLDRKLPVPYRMGSAVRTRSPPARAPEWPPAQPRRVPVLAPASAKAAAGMLNILSCRGHTPRDTAGQRDNSPDRGHSSTQPRHPRLQLQSAPPATSAHPFSLRPHPRPVNFGARFSRKARTPSAKSSVAAQAAKLSVSRRSCASNPSPNVACSKAFVRA